VTLIAKQLLIESTDTAFMQRLVDFLDNTSAERGSTVVRVLTVRVLEDDVGDQVAVKAASAAGEG